MKTRCVPELGMLDFLLYFSLSFINFLVNDLLMVDSNLLQGKNLPKLHNLGVEDQTTPDVNDVRATDGPNRWTMAGLLVRASQPSLGDYELKLAV